MADTYLSMTQGLTNSTPVWYKLPVKLSLIALRELTYYTKKRSVFLSHN